MKKYIPLLILMNKHLIMISVIIPVYNVENYIEKCLDSVCNQSFKDLEIICVNDGSTDNSLKLLEDYAKRDSRIKIITQENRGPGHARNTGLKNATGEYVLFVDSDDFLCENSLDELYYNINSNNSDLVIFKFFNYNEKNNTFRPSGIPLDELFVNVDYNNFTFTFKDIKMHVMYDYFAVWFKLYKKDFLDKYNLSFPIGIAYEDVLFQIQSFIYADKMSFLPKPLYNYRSNPKSLTSDATKIFDIIEVIDSIEKFLKENSLYEYFEFEFLMFKIIHYTYRVRLSKGTDYFNFVKSEFTSLKNNPKFKIDDLTPKARTMFENVFYSNNLDEYLRKI